MTLGAAASPDLDSLHRDLRAAHPYPLWLTARDLLPEYPKPCAILWIWRAANVWARWR
jgi:hypothetical protein